MKKFENFQRALRNLEEIRKCKEPYEMIVLTGQVALFEICFEQSWKAMKEILGTMCHMRTMKELLSESFLKPRLNISICLKSWRKKSKVIG